MQVSVKSRAGKNHPAIQMPGIALRRLEIGVRILNIGMCRRHVALREALLAGDI